MGRPLEGMLVMSVERAVAALLCTSRVADAGARVIKVERPEGDFALGYDRAAHGQSSYFVWLSPGKELVVLPPASAIFDDERLPGPVPALDEDTAAVHAEFAR